MVGVYIHPGGNQVRDDGPCLGEFSVTYKPVRPGWPGIKATYSCFIPSNNLFG